MPELVEKHVGCPYCGQIIDILVDDSLPEQRYVEDCQVCCRPILFSITMDRDGDVSVAAMSENE